MPNEFEKGSAFSFNQIIEYSSKAIVSKQILKKEAGNISLFAFDKGEALSEHSAPFDALVYVVDGKADIKIDGISNILTQGQSIIMPANIPHSVFAVEKFKMLLTMIKSQ